MDHYIVRNIDGEFSVRPEGDAPAIAPGTWTEMVSYADVVAERLAAAKAEAAEAPLMDLQADIQTALGFHRLWSSAGSDAPMPPGAAEIIEERLSAALDKAWAMLEQRGVRRARTA